MTTPKYELIVQRIAGVCLLIFFPVVVVIAWGVENLLADGATPREATSMVWGEWRREFWDSEEEA